jgi:hypothetical protein
LQVWGGLNLFKNPDIDNNNKMKENQDNSDTLEWLFEDRYYDTSSKSIKSWDDNIGKCKAIYQFMTLMSLVQYHNDA